MGENFLVVAVHQPVIGINAGIVVSADRVGTLGSGGGYGHGLHFDSIYDIVREVVVTMAIGLIPKERT
jgi:hypothetical protein